MKPPFSDLISLFRERNSRFGDPGLAAENCQGASAAFADTLLDAGWIKKRDVGRTWEIEEIAFRPGQSFDATDFNAHPNDVYPSSHDTNHYLFRYTTDSGSNWYMDWTARQFRDDAPFPLIWSELPVRRNSDESLRRLERAAAAAGPYTDDTPRLYTELRRSGLEHLAAMDRLWLVFGSDEAIAPLDKLAIATELAGQADEDHGERITRLVWPVDAVVLAEAIGLDAEDLDGVVHDAAEADAADPDDEDVVEAMHELATAANNDGLQSQFRFLIQHGMSLSNAIGDAVAESDKSDLNMALNRRLGDSTATLYVRGGLVTESFDPGPGGRSVLVDFARMTAFVYHARETLWRVIYSLDMPIVERQRFPSETARLLPLCKKLWELQTSSVGRVTSFWAIRRALDFAVNGLLHSISSGRLGAVDAALPLAALEADENGPYLRGGLALSAGELFP